MIDPLALQEELAGLSPEASKLVGEYLSRPSIQTQIKHQQIRDRIDQLMARGKGKTEAVAVVAGEFHKAISTVWKI